MARMACCASYIQQLRCRWWASAQWCAGTCCRLPSHVCVWLGASVLQPPRPPTMASTGPELRKLTSLQARRHMASDVTRLSTGSSHHPAVSESFPSTQPQSVLPDTALDAGVTVQVGMAGRCLPGCMQGLTDLGKKGLPLCSA
jgi:hypothetical protein